MPTFKELNVCGYLVTQTVQLVSDLTSPPDFAKVTEDGLWQLSGGSEVDAGVYQMQIVATADSPMNVFAVVPFTVTAVYKKAAYMPDLFY